MESPPLSCAHWQIVWRGRGIIHDHEPETTENQRAYNQYSYGCPGVYHRFVSDCKRPVSFPERKDALRVFINPPDKSACVPSADEHLCRNGPPLPKDTVFQHATFSNSRHISTYPGCSWIDPDTGNEPLPIDLWHNINECVPVTAPSFPGIILLTVGKDLQSISPLLGSKSPCCYVEREYQWN